MNSAVSDMVTGIPADKAALLTTIVGALWRMALLAATPTVTLVSATLTGALTLAATLNTGSPPVSTAPLNACCWTKLRLLKSAGSNAP